MTLPNSGVPLSLDQIQVEFGGSAPTSLTEYYGGGSYVPSSIVNQSGQAIPQAGTISINDFYGTNKNQPNPTIQSMNLSSNDYPTYYTLTIWVELDRTNLTGSTLSFNTTIYVNGVAGGNILVNIPNNSKSASTTTSAINKQPTSGTPGSVSAYVTYGAVQSNSVIVYQEYQVAPPTVTELYTSSNNNSVTGAGPVTITFSVYTDSPNSTGSPVTYNVVPWLTNHNNQTSQGTPVPVTLNVNAGTAAYGQLDVLRVFNNGVKLNATVWCTYGWLTSNETTLQTTY